MSKTALCDHMKEDEQSEIVSLLDDIVENVVKKERLRRKHVSTATLYRCDDPSEIVVANSFEEMNRIVEEYRNRPENNFYMCLTKFCRDDAIGAIRPRISWYIRDDRYISITRLYTNDADLEGLPYTTLGRTTLGCNLAREKAKMLYKDRSNKKCPAIITVKKMLFFPEFKLKKDEFMQTIEQKLKAKIQNHEVFEKKIVYIITFPKGSHHTNHFKKIEKVKEVLCGEVLQKVQELVMQNTPLSSIYDEIQNYVNNIMFYKQTPPEKHNQRYFPNSRRICSIRYSVFTMFLLQKPRIQSLKEGFKTMKDDFGTEVSFRIDEPPSINHSKLSKQTHHEKAIPYEENVHKSPQIDVTQNQVLLNELVIKDAKDTKCSGHVAENDYAVYGENHNEPIKTFSELEMQKIYLFHQSKSQQYLLNRYGCFIYLTEVKPQQVSYRPVSVSVFLICVRTNVDCQVVGTILCNKYIDHAKVLKEALTEFKEINEFWKPKYIITDPSDSMVSVIKELFPDTEYFFNKEACLRKWEDYLTNPLNGVKEHGDNVLNDLKSLQMSSSMEEFTNQMKEIKKSTIWNSQVDLQFRKKWFAISKKWANCCFPQLLSLLLKEKWLNNLLMAYENTVLLSTSRSSAGGIYHLTNRLTSSIPEDQYKSYRLKNEQIFIGYQSILKDKREPFLNQQSSPNGFDLPLYMISQCQAQIKEMEDNKSTTVKKVSIGSFDVYVENDDKSSTVSFGSQRTFPTCTCKDWKNDALPCKHFFHVFKKAALSFEELSPLYRSNPSFKFDDSCIKHVDIVTTQDKMTQSEIDCSANKNFITRPQEKPTPLYSPPRTVEKSVITTIDIPPELKKIGIVTTQDKMTQSEIDCSANKDFITRPQEKPTSPTSLPRTVKKSVITTIDIPSQLKKGQQTLPFYSLPLVMEKCVIHANDKFREPFTFFVSSKELQLPSLGKNQITNKDKFSENKPTINITTKEVSTQYNITEINVEATFQESINSKEAVPSSSMNKPSQKKTNSIDRIDLPTQYNITRSLGNPKSKAFDIDISFLGKLRNCLCSFYENKLETSSRQYIFSKAEFLDTAFQYLLKSTNGSIVEFNTQTLQKIVDEVFYPELKKRQQSNQTFLSSSQRCGQNPSTNKTSSFPTNNKELLIKSANHIPVSSSFSSNQFILPKNQSSKQINTQSSTQNGKPAQTKTKSKQKASKDVDHTEPRKIRGKRKPPKTFENQDKVEVKKKKKTRSATRFNREAMKMSQYPAFITSPNPTLIDTKNLPESKIKIEVDDIDFGLDIDSVTASKEQNSVKESLEKISKLREQLDASLRNEISDQD